MTAQASYYKILILFILFLAFHAGLIISARDYRASWANVPPAPSEKGAATGTLGDRQLNYRMISMMLQNLGNLGGEARPFDEYNYAELEKWFFLADKMDSQSSYVPFLAAYYFSGAKQPENLNYIVDYLAWVGSNPKGEKWRWLAQAVYLARFKIEDYDKALGYAEELSAMWQEGRPLWMLHMPALVNTQAGDKKAALAISVNILAAEADNIHPAEVNFLVDYICNRLLEGEDKTAYEFCSEAE